MTISSICRSWETEQVEGPDSSESANMCRRRPAFCVPCVTVLSPLITEGLCSRNVADALGTTVSTVPISTLVAAGVSVGVLGAAFESVLNVLYNRKRVQPSDDELCSFCSGFGSVRCEICNSQGVLFIMGTNVERTCPACKGRKRERCRRCAGSGKSGMKKKAQIPP